MSGFLFGGPKRTYFELFELNFLNYLFTFFSNNFFEFFNSNSFPYNNVENL